MEWSGEENQNLKEFFHLFGRTRVGMAQEQREADRHPPSPFLSTSCQPVGPAIVSSTMKKKDSWTRFGREITAFAAGKRLGREEEIFRPRRRRICRHFHAFSRRPYWAMIGRCSLARKLAVNVTKKGIMARRRCLTKHPSFPPSRPSRPARPSRGDR